MCKLQWLLQSFFRSVEYVQKLHLYFLGGREGVDEGLEEDVTVEDGALCLVERVGLDGTVWGWDVGI